MIITDIKTGKIFDTDIRSKCSFRYFIKKNDKNIFSKIRFPEMSLSLSSSLYSYNPFRNAQVGIVFNADIEVIVSRTKCNQSSDNRIFFVVAFTLGVI